MTLSTTWKLTLIILVVLIISGAVFFGVKHFRLDQKNPPANKINLPTIPISKKSEANSIVDRVGKLIALPQGEDPTIATITDITKLSNQPFFAGAQNGDKVLVYSRANQIILYDPNSNNVIRISSPNSSTPSAQLTSVKLTIRNGTDINGLGKKIGDKITKNFPIYTISKVENANNSNYNSSVIILLNSQAQEAVSNLSKMLNATESALPAGENKPDSDILIILGKDQAQ